MIQGLGKQLVREAVTLNVQDIYILPEGDNYIVYFRLNEERYYSENFQSGQLQQLISHFKFLAGMNVGEKRRCQLGSCDYSIGENSMISLRFSTVGDYRGFESMVIRIIYPFDNNNSYWSDKDKKLKQYLIGRGLFLFSGPVGSGKTSLMYQLIAERAKNSQVITIEDPVEIKNNIFLQLQVNESIGMTYDNLIKLSLRHRPDILVIGEIRDKETAKAAIRASLTGAMVFSTVHAKSIPGVYARLLELGISHNELENTLKLIVYQRIMGKKGLIDFAHKNFIQHTHEDWNQEINQLVTKGCLSREEGEKEKIIF
ncbi:competence type IV pilus ATPase ComGA [Streptococcus hongkongensis]|nr:competence protein CglA [Streptococcus uberis]